MCVVESGGIVNPAGIMISKPTQAPIAMDSARSVYRPAGQQAPKVVQKPKQVNVGGFGTQQAKRQLGTSYEQAATAEVDNRIEKQLAMLQQQIMQLTPAKPPPAAKPALSLVQPNIIVEPNFAPAVDTSPVGINTNALDACGAPTQSGTFEQIDRWDTGFMGRVQVQVNALSPGWSVLLIRARQIDGAVLKVKFKTSNLFLHRLDEP